MKIMLSLVLLLSIPALTLAIEDPRPDVMGFYFDPNYPLEERPAGMAVPFDVYAVLMNPSQPVITAFEFGYDHWVPAGMEGLVVRLTTTYPPGIIIIDPPLDPLVGSYQLAFAAPTPTAQYTVLMSWQYMLMGEFEVGFQMTGGDVPTIPGGLPGYYWEGGIVACDHAQTCHGTGAWVNRWCPLPTEPQSWGTLKGLYR